MRFRWWNGKRMFGGLKGQGSPRVPVWGSGGVVGVVGVSGPDPAATCAGPGSPGPQAAPDPAAQAAGRRPRQHRPRQHRIRQHRPQAPAAPDPAAQAPAAPDPAAQAAAAQAAGPGSTGSGSTGSGSTGRSSAGRRPRQHRAAGRSSDLRKFRYIGLQSGIFSPSRRRPPFPVPQLRKSPSPGGSRFSTPSAFPAQPDSRNVLRRRWFRDFTAQ
jgi:hypothetical protein